MNRLAAAPLVLAALLFCACAAGPADEPAAPVADGPHPLAGRAIAPPEPPDGGEVDLPRYPSISPDGRTICFSWRGDLWSVDAAGGQATRLTVHPGLDDLSVWSPDGTQIAFNSMRSGFRNVHRMNADGTGVAQVTREDRYLFISDWLNDGRLAMTGYLEADVHKNPRPYLIDDDGGPIIRLHDAFGRSPVVSPDGRYAAFVRGRAPWDRPFLTNSDNRDLWLYDRVEKTFRRLTTNPGNDGKPKWLDNDTLVYLSARPPARINLYRMDPDGGEAGSVALTAFSDSDVLHFDATRDGKTAVLHVWDTLYTLDLADADAQPKPLTITAPTDAEDLTLVQNLPGESDQAALSPDGKVVAVSARGELFVRTVESKNPPQRITGTIALDSQPVWSPDGRFLYYTSDRDGTLSIYRAAVVLTRSEIEASINPPELPAPENSAIEPEEPINQDPENEATALRADEEPANTDNQEDPEQKPDEKETPPDPNAPERWHEAVRFVTRPVVRTDHHDADPSPSPDGKTLAFRRGNGTLVLLDLASGEERAFLDSWDSSMHWAWSADSRYLAVSYEDQDHNADIWVGPADGSAAPVNITKHPDADLIPSFSQDGKILSFVSQRNDDQFDVYAVYLDKDLETYTPQQLEDYYKDAAEKAKKLKPLVTENPESTEQGDPVQATDGDDKAEQAGDAAAPDAEAQGAAEAPEPLDLDDAYLRLRRLTRTSETEWNARVLPDGGRVFFTRGSTGYVIGWNGQDEKKVADNIDPQQLSLTGSHVAALRDGDPALVELANGKTTDVAFPGSIRVNRQDAQRQRFIECARAITMNFYDESFKGIDWDGATEKYGRLASRAWTADEFDDIANRYLGLLNASHMGIRTPEPSATNSEANGRLGAAYRRHDAGYQVTAIEPRTPAAEGVMKLQVGDIITSIDFKPIGTEHTIASRLVGRVGRETAITVLRHRPGQHEPDEIYLLVTPISYDAYNDIRYDNWQFGNKAKVDALSEGRLGYIHIRSMNEGSLSDFERDLYAACEGRDGLIIDVRDNGGGWTTDRLLASIMTRRHAYTVPRGADPDLTNSYPNDRLFIARYNLPINALCNENSFSNAEIFSHAFKTLGRGTLVGNTTAGGVISTGGTRLLDGTSIRLPFRGWYLPDGTDMENHGAIPDLLMPQTPEDEAAGRDAQLEAAVADLLGRLDPA